MSTFGRATPFEEIALVLATVGIGNGLFSAPNLKAIMGSVPAGRAGIASASCIDWLAQSFLLGLNALAPLLHVSWWDPDESLVVLDYLRQ
jgi:hypothetical protein